MGLKCGRICRNFATLVKCYKSSAHFDGLFLILQNSKPTLANLLRNRANFHGCKWPNIETQFNHLVTLAREGMEGLVVVVAVSHSYSATHTTTVV